jgi:hypothetical protein
MQQPGNRIDIRAGDDDAFDRRGAKAAARLKDLLRFDLLAKIRRGVDQEPALTVATYGKGCLASGHDARLASTRTTTGFCV